MEENRVCQNEIQQLHNEKLEFPYTLKKNYWSILKNPNFLVSEMSFLTIMTNFYSHSLNLQNNTRLGLTDKNGVKIGDSNENETSISKESFWEEQFSNLTSVKFALEGKSGTIIE